MRDPETQIVLTGVPDLMIACPRNRIAILDLKTARYSNHQDSLLPMYQVQLVGYALIAESRGMGDVEALGLVYCEPPECDDDKGLESLVNYDGFNMPFKATTVPVEFTRSMIPPLLRKAKELMEMEEATRGREDCGDCGLVEKMVRLAGGKLCGA
jgi:hypothetical protein